MSSIKRGIRLGLDPRTKKLMKEFFDGNKCHKCGEQAERCYKNKFWCHKCSEKDPPPVETREVKMNR